jgi:hypothetical protein
MLDEGKSYGVKMMIVDKIDYDNLKEIGDAMQKLGFRVELEENGVMRFFKEVEKKSE